MIGRSHRFTHAITRAPAASAVDGLRAEDRGAPEIGRFRAQHAAYVATLRAAGVAVEELPALEDFPDSAFVEDTALCLPGLAVVLRPGAPSRRGEAAAIAPALAAAYREVLALEGPGTVDGGDILVTGREIVVGRSARTDAAGIEALARLLGPRGETVRGVAVPESVLHLKSDCAVLDDETVLATPRLAAGGAFAGYRVLETPEGEAAAANLIRVNDTVLAPAGYPRTADMLARAGYDVRPVAVDEAAKLDAGLSCLSLRFALGAG